ncbi:UDP-N-acetylglucosamine--N-acetylmuramyl-(pentapeptide) pyrophosphoryl-undecaprenol N-acetylglucosamine transferase [Cytobacillus horneckiae]|uniref:UDP-N-acetylglucosamine--N-acetylmuramyl-(pentapeptide) pyrophosphoryl-undecaprenol N-acetylglucosamine transferase n=1 Tax=Cytobacillus horneckiae TaxID=549687 RepID=A0A2N0ZBG9_9BACI|nr:undecaprenyldiphospho-muramoylpentapeptide beta-N-acetylglucosaminyltransferase [Cytobacillus horneckiae]MBN6887066.1 undecaprenyldiphospho-muramoylpentapeptide beta-N-acetylglucosaminyltransferase [Cytobacillus horneckiae]MCM3178343.1 undecaprenyldiphospho-muramoylpentapeptide beta-N-acetylglucosaminyltransferase [Cytobacillus horneckiae]MEC1156917.1 undecaprenyldiphospho-muramoylpentapeptide beta-N-acetylglucosaminyltransferase [Cytobacillus horneckiae]MED2940057.1 undecaprenyldiphospho-mu
MKIAVSGGGTGGHIYPALALIREIQKNDKNAEFLYIGTQSGLESSIVPRENIPFQSIHITGFKRKLSFDNVKTVIRFIKGVKDSKKILKDFNADIVIGTGGYVCGPVVYAAAKLGIPTIVHEQNSVPGLTNKFLSRYVDKVAVCFDEAASFFPKEKVIMTGNPRATEVLGQNAVNGKLSVGLDPAKQSVLIFGGSRGARPINEAVLKTLAQLAVKPYEILYVTGEVHYENVKKEAELAGNPSNIKIKPFIHNMPEVLAGTDLAVTRAGATTLAELTSLGIPSILIPSPYVTNNHQEKNARALSDHGAAELLLEQDLTGSKLVDSIDRILLDDEKIREMRAAAKKIGVPDSANRLYAVMQELVSQGKK